VNDYGKPRNDTAQQDQRAHELIGQLHLLEAVDRRVTPEHVARRFHELLGSAGSPAPADVNRQALRKPGIQRARRRRLSKVLRRVPAARLHHRQPSRSRSAPWGRPSRLPGRITGTGYQHAAAETARAQDEQRTVIAADIQNGSHRHRRLPRILRRIPLLVFAADALLLMYFFSGVTNVDWSSPFSAALVFAILLAVMVTGISFAFFRFAGDRLPQYKNDAGTVGYRRRGATPEAGGRPHRRALDQIRTPLPGSSQSGRRPRYEKRPRRSYYRLTDAVALTIAAVVAVAVAVAATVFGLRFSISSPASSSAGAKVVIVATATANEPAPALPVDILQALRSAGSSSAGATAYVVAPGSSQPDTISLTPRRADGQADHGLTRTAALDAYISAVERALGKEGAAGQLDLLAAIAAAVRTTSSPGTLIVVSSGLSTAGGFDLRQVGWDADPSSLAAQLEAAGQLPDLTGWHVVFSGLGDVAGPQPALPQPQQATLESYWRAICQAADAASCGIDTTARPQLASHVTNHAPVVPVPVVALAAGPRSTTITTLPDALLFEFDSTALIPYADKILQPVVQQARSQHLQVSITGFASPDGGSSAYNLALSAQRAEAVRDRLAALGLPAGQITQVTGGGTGGKRIDACLVHGRLDEAVCAQLRRVVIVLSR
jgi:outer membrane protein OmpA-like peptidoglycan-associated protein